MEVLSMLKAITWVGWITVGLLAIVGSISVFEMFVLMGLIAIHYVIQVCDDRAHARHIIVTTNQEVIYKLLRGEKE